MLDNQICYPIIIGNSENSMVCYQILKGYDGESHVMSRKVCRELGYAMVEIDAHFL